MKDSDIFKRESDPCNKCYIQPVQTLKTDLIYKFIDTHCYLAMTYDNLEGHLSRPKGQS